MALTPEDVVNKRFQSTKFREGYDQDEVDDFLDEIVVELRRLGQENDELKQRLTAADARISDSQRSGSPVAPVEVTGQSADNAVVATPSHDGAGHDGAGHDGAGHDGADHDGADSDGADRNGTDQVHEHSSDEEAHSDTPAAQPSSDEDTTSDASGLLQLARRLHDEHVREGNLKKEQLISDGQVEADRILGEAKTEQLAMKVTLDSERSALQSRVDELRTFEREYRQQLRTYIEGQLEELEGTAQPTAGGSAVSAGSAAATGSAAAGSASSVHSAPGVSS
jgi:DivIVA domain-containing protein